MTSNLNGSGIKYLVANGQVIVLYLCPDGLFRDRDGTVYALRDEKSADAVERCGVGGLSLDPNHPLTSACKPHDFMYSSRAYQTFHTRAEADRELERLVKLVDEGKYSIWAKPFRWISRIFGGMFWENKNTR